MRTIPFSQHDVYMQPMTKNQLELVMVQEADRVICNLESDWDLRRMIS